MLQTLTSPPAAASTPTMSPTGQPSFSPTLTFPPTLAPTVPADVTASATWASIRVTAMVSALTMFALITLFEVGRRSYTLRDIFDRKKETRTGRTHPKLLSRARTGPLNGVKNIGKYLFVDGYVQKEYSNYARQIQNRESNSDQMRPVIYITRWQGPVIYITR